MVSTDCENPTNMKIFYENSSILADKVKNALEDNDTKYALSLLQDDQNYAALKTGSGELVPVISKYISWKYETENIEIFNGCLELLKKVIENALPEELLVQLLEVIESSVDTTQFTTILSYVFEVLQKISRDRSDCLSWTLNSLQVRLNKCNVPVYNETSIESEDDVFHIEIYYQDILGFYETIIPYFAKWFQEHKVYRLIFVKYLIQLLAEPIGYLDLGPHNEKTKLRKIAENIVRKVSSLCNDPFKYMQMDDEDFLNPTSFAYGIFLHFIFDENVDYNMVPKVYNNTYLFQSSLIYIIEHLQSVNDAVILKGLCTLKMLLKRTPRLSHLVLDIEANKSLWEVMESIIVYNKYQEIRRQALDVFKLYLFKYKPKGQYLLLTNLVFKIGHAGLSGFIITQYKEILFGLQQKNQSEVINFQGDKMYKFIKNCYESIDTEGNLQYDKIISLLNLMRYAVIQEKNFEQLENTATIWKKQFFDRLQYSLKELKEELKQMIFKMENDKSLPDFNINEDGTVSKADKLKGLNISLTQIEMTDSILKRLFELIAEIKR